MQESWKQSFVDQYRKHFGLAAYRRKYHIRMDLFNEMSSSEKNKQDNQILRRLASTTQDLSNICFKQCIDIKYQYFTIEEGSCVEACVKDYFRSYEIIAQNVLKQAGPGKPQ